MRRSMGQQLREAQQQFTSENYSLGHRGVMLPSDYRATSKSKAKVKEFGGNLKYKEELMKSSFLKFLVSHMNLYLNFDS